MIWWYIGARNHVSICLSTINSDSINSINIDSNNIKCNNDKTNIINSYSTLSNDKCTLSYSDEYEVDYDVVDTKGNTTTILHTLLLLLRLPLLYSYYYCYYTNTNTNTNTTNTKNLINSDGIWHHLNH